MDGIIKREKNGLILVLFSGTRYVSHVVDVFGEGGFFPGIYKQFSMEKM